MFPRIDISSKRLAGAAALFFTFASPGHAEPVLRVCAPSDNFPLSDRSENGFENKLAQLIVRSMRVRLDYTWWPARENFLDQTLNAGKCDVVMGIASGIDGVETTRPYYRSGYVFLSRTDKHLKIKSLADPRLRRLRIGVYLIGNNQTPATLALSREGISRNVAGYISFYDRSGKRVQSGLINALYHRSIDVAAVWGPLVGYYRMHGPVSLAIQPIETDDFAPLIFRYDIAIGVRKGRDQLRNALDRVIATRADSIRAILERYGVPLLPMSSHRARIRDKGA